MTSPPGDYKEPGEVMHGKGGSKKLETGSHQMKWRDSDSNPPDKR